MAHLARAMWLVLGLLWAGCPETDPNAAALKALSKPATPASKAPAPGSLLTVKDLAVAAQRGEEAGVWLRVTGAVAALAPLPKEGVELDAKISCEIGRLVLVDLPPIVADLPQSPGASPAPIELNVYRNLGLPGPPDQCYLLFTSIVRGRRGFQPVGHFCSDAQGVRPCRRPEPREPDTEAPAPAHVFDVSTEITDHIGSLQLRYPGLALTFKVMALRPLRSFDRLYFAGECSQGQTQHKVRRTASDLRLDRLEPGETLQYRGAVGLLDEYRDNPERCELRFSLGASVGEAQVFSTQCLRDGRAFEGPCAGSKAEPSPPSGG